MDLYLGIDASTQGVKAVVIDAGDGTLKAEAAVNFGADLPQYGAPSGFIPCDDPLVRQADPMMWLDGLELLLERLAATGIPMAAIRGIAGAAQQHATVYLKANFADAMRTLSPEGSLSAQLRPCLARPVSPIWMDRSTSAECAELTARFGGRLQQDTGSPAIERFPAAQIRRFAKHEPEAYAATAVIHLASSFLCAVLCGGNAPIDYGDGAGMNLLNLHNILWDKEIAEFSANGLLERLPKAAPSATIAGNLHPYFTKFGLTAGTPVAAWTGDNPSSLIGTGAGLPGCAGISLGTSDTFFGRMDDFKTDPQGCGHVFGNPAGGFMSLICFSNGSLAREHVKDECGVSWEFFDEEACRQTPPGNDGCLLLPYYSTESTPLVLSPEPKPNFDWKNASAACRIRALLESQALAMRLHTLWLQEPVECIRLTGGASKAASFRQIIADVFQARVEVAPTTNACALGAAMRAAAVCGAIPLPELTAAFCQTAVTVQPRRDLASCYQEALERYRALEESGTKA